MTTKQLKDLHDRLKSNCTKLSRHVKNAQDICPTKKVVSGESKGGKGIEGSWARLVNAIAEFLFSKLLVKSGFQDITFNKKRIDFSAQHNNQSLHFEVTRVQAHSIFPEVRIEENSGLYLSPLDVEYFFKLIKNKADKKKEQCRRNGLPLSDCYICICIEAGALNESFVRPICEQSLRDLANRVEGELENVVIFGPGFSIGLNSLLRGSSLAHFYWQFS